MANLLGNSLFTNAISGLNTNYLLLLNGSNALSIEDILKPSENTLNYTVNQSFRSYMLNNFNNIDMDGDGKITSQDLTNYTAKLQTQGMTYNELTQLCSSGSTTMSSLLDTVLSNFTEIDTNHDGRITQSEINAYRINQEIKDVKDQYPRIDPNNMSVFYDNRTANANQTESKQDRVFK